MSRSINEHNNGNKGCRKARRRVKRSNKGKVLPRFDSPEEEAADLALLDRWEVYIKFHGFGFPVPC